MDLEAACLNQFRSLLVSPKYDNEKGMTLRIKVLYPVQRATIDRVGLLKDLSLSNILRAGAG